MIACSPKLMPKNLPNIDSGWAASKIQNAVRRRKLKKPTAAARSPGGSIIINDQTPLLLLNDSMHSHASYSMSNTHYSNDGVV
jgi:hypothetical protein